jgi:hypothetical protein
MRTTHAGSGKHCSRFSRTARSVFGCLLIAGAVASALFLFGAIEPAGAAPRKQDPQRLRVSDNALRQMRALLVDKESRTPAQQKIDSQLLYGLKRMRQEPIAAGVESLAIDISVDSAGMVLVDITARNTSEVVTRIQDLGGQVISELRQFGALRARVALDKLENLADSSEVKQISRADTAITNRAPRPARSFNASRLRERLAHALASNLTSTHETGWHTPLSPLIGAATSAGDVAHRADQV